MRVHVSLHCALIATALAASVSAADLPVSRAALAREGLLVREGAKMVVTPHPYNVRPEDLCAFRMFMDELAPFKDKVLPFPRTKPATVAVFYSKATSIQRDSLPSLKGRPGVSDWYAALLHANFPCRVVFDEDVPNLGPEVQALVFPVAACCATNVIDAARRFLERGGLVFSMCR